MLPSVFECFSSHQLFFVAIEIIQELLSRPKTFQSTLSQLNNKLSFNPGPNNELVKFIFQKILYLKPTYLQAVSEEDDETARAIVSLISVAGQSHVEMIVRREEEASDLLRFLLECTSHCDKRIASLTLPFWDVLTESLQKQEEKVSYLPCIILLTNFHLFLWISLKISSQKIFQPVYIKLLEIILTQTAYSNGQQIDEDFLDFRKQSRDGLLYCFDILEESYFQVVFQALTQCKASIEYWGQLEAILFSIRCIAQGLQTVEPIPVVDQVLQFLFGFPYHPLVAKTGVLTLSEYDRYLQRHPKNLGPAITFMLDCLESGDENLLYCASRSFQIICKVCGPLMVSELQKMIQICINPINSDLVIFSILSLSRTWSTYKSQHQR